MAIMNSKGDSASPWKIPLRIFVSAKLLPPAVNSPPQVLMFFCNNDNNNNNNNNNNMCH